MKKRIVVDGREYGSVDEMPPEVRRAYEERKAGLAEESAPSAELDEERLHAMLRSAEPRRPRLSRGVGTAVAFGVVLVFVLLMLVLGSL